MRLLAPELIEDPYPFYARWREEAPIWFDEESRGWVLSRHDDVRSVLKDSATWSSKAMGDRSEAPLPLLTDDPPRHTQLRRIVDRAFTMRMLKSVEPKVAAIAERLVAQIPADSPVDIVRQLTTPLPVAVIAEMMGIPPERADDFKRWSDALTGTLAGASIEDRQKDIGEMVMFFGELIPERRANPGEDLVSAVVNAEVDGEHLADGDIIGFNILLLIAGNETTTNMLGNLLNILADSPEQYAELRAHPERIDAAIEETLRYDSPVQFLMRKALRDMNFYGQEVTAGEKVMVLTGSANRDPRSYDLADQFRLDRPKNHHHAFGFGIHFCMGAPLARMEARAALQPLLARFADLGRAEGQDERVPSHLLRGFHHLQVLFGEG